MCSNSWQFSIFDIMCVCVCEREREREREHVRVPYCASNKECHQYYKSPP